MICIPHRKQWIEVRDLMRKLKRHRDHLNRNSKNNAQDLKFVNGLIRHLHCYLWQAELRIRDERYCGHHKCGVCDMEDIGNRMKPMYRDRVNDWCPEYWLDRYGAFVAQW